MMMDVDYREIQSVESSDDPRPWHIVEVDGDDVMITDDKDGGREAGIQNARTALPGHVDLPDESAVSESGDVTYAVTDDGEFISYDPENADTPPLRAHLGWFDSETDTLTLLKFVG